MAAYYKVEVSLNTNAVEVGVPSPQTVNVVVPTIGPQGEKGDQGDVGNTGPANSLAIGTVSTGAAGSNASATITGAAPSQTLDLSIPRGDKGETGDTGASGPANSLAIGTVTTGAEGSSADATISGTAPSQTLSLVIPVGATGAVGATGPQGPAGTATTSASDLTSGTLADARLSANVALEDVANTFTQNQTLNGTNNVAPNQTAASGSSVMTRDLVDARFGTTYLLTLASNLTSVDDTTQIQSSDTVVLPAGTYTVDAFLRGTINSATSGINMGITKIAAEGANGSGQTSHFVWTSNTFNASDGTQLGAGFNGNSNGALNFIYVFTDAATRRTLQSHTRGILILTATRTMCFHIQQRHATDASNAATLLADFTYARFVKIK
jgi:hypothetical protein